MNYCSMTHCLYLRNLENLNCISRSIKTHHSNLFKSNETVRIHNTLIPTSVAYSLPDNNRSHCYRQRFLYIDHRDGTIIAVEVMRGYNVY